MVSQTGSDALSPCEVALILDWAAYGDHAPGFVEIDTDNAYDGTRVMITFGYRSAPADFTLCPSGGHWLVERWDGDDETFSTLIEALAWIGSSERAGVGL